MAGRVLGEEGEAGHAGEDVGVGGDDEGEDAVGVGDVGAQGGQGVAARVVEGREEEHARAEPEGDEQRAEEGQVGERVEAGLGAAGGEEVGAEGGGGGQRWDDVEDEPGLLVWLEGVHGDEDGAGQHEWPCLFREAGMEKREGDQGQGQRIGK